MPSSLSVSKCRISQLKIAMNTCNGCSTLLLHKHICYLVYSQLSKIFITLIINYSTVGNCYLFITRTALPELDPPADLVLSNGFWTGPFLLVKLFVDKLWLSQEDFPIMVPPKNINFMFLNNDQKYQSIKLKHVIWSSIKLCCQPIMEVANATLQFYILEHSNI